MIRQDEELERSETVRDGTVARAAISPLGNKLRQIRSKYIARGGRLFSRKELRQEMAERRGGAYRFEYEKENIR